MLQQTYEWHHILFPSLRLVKGSRSRVLNTCTTRSTEKDVGTHKMFGDQGCITKIGQGGKEFFWTALAKRSPK